MATKTSTASGNLSAGATWVGGVAPSDGDYLDIRHTVTFDAAFIAGDYQPGAPQDAPTLGKTTGGSLAAATYTVRLSITDAGGKESYLGLRAALATDATNNRLTVTTPALPTGASSFNIYIFSGTLWYVQATAIAGSTLTNIDSISTATPIAYTNTAIRQVSPGKLIVNENLTIRGDLIMEGTTTDTDDIVTIAAGKGIEFDASGSDTTGLGYQFVQGLVNARDSVYWKTNGTSVSRCYIRSNASGPNTYFNNNSEAFAQAGDIELAFTDVTRMGLASTTMLCFHPSADAGVGTRWYMEGCVFDACGETGTGTIAALGNVSIINCTWKNSLSTSRNISFAATATPSGTRVIKGSVFDKKPRIGVLGLTLGGSSAGDENIFFENPSASGAQRATSLEQCFIRHVSDTSFYRLGDWDNCVCVCDGNTYDGNGRYSAKADLANVHWTTPATGPAGTYRIDNSIVEGFGMDDVGDFDYGPNTTNFNSIITYTIGVPYKKDAGTNYSVGTLTTINGWSGAACEYDHNTWYCRGQGLLALAEGGVGVAGMVNSFRSNIGWGPAADTASGSFRRFTYYPTHINDFTGLTEGQVLETQVGYNARHHLNTSSGTETVTGAYTDGGALGGSYHHYDTSAVDFDANDVTGDPGFVDTEASMWKWVASIVGGTIPAPASGGSPITTDTTTESGRKDLFAWGMYLLSLKNEPSHADYQASATLANYMAHIRAGFTPTNAALEDAGHDGVTIGAVEGDFGVLSIPIVMHYRRMMGVS